ncbi:MAG: PSD1 and planctomycete cytochrome C domain-containing protein [Isosphaeraceae bacterium]
MPRSLASKGYFMLPAMLILAATALQQPAQANNPSTPTAEQVEFFESRVRPVLVRSCQGCHGAEKQKGGLRLDSPEALLAPGSAGPVIEPGNPDASRLIEALRYESETKMPPKGKLADREIAALSDWVRMGAPWPRARSQAATVSPNADSSAKRHWAFQPIRKTTPPVVREKAWVASPIDAFVLQRLEARGIRPVEFADRRTLIRRVTFDLIGLPPTPAEVEAFQADSAPDAYGRLIERLLASPRYGERWGRHWLDVARYGEDQAHTFEARLYPQGYRYRDWVVNALNTDLPYNQFVEAQIAGDLLNEPGREDRLAALGFFALGPVYYGKAVADELDDRIDTLSRGFLGLTVACARCHDHKFDPIPTTDYYALSGIFASTRYKEYPAVPPEVVARFEGAKAAVQAKSAEVDAFLALGAIQGVYALPIKSADRGLTTGARERLAALRKELVALEKSAPPPYPVIHSLTEAEVPTNSRVHIRGNPENLGDEVPRRFLSVVAGPRPVLFTRGSGRLELARAITNPENPLTARVIVNRVWEHHFGRGLVATPSNFGTLGEPPTHPELLDFLAAEFMESGWSLKNLHRTILLSSTYQLSSRIEPRNAEIDGDNTLLWRMNRRRLEVEAWRDGMLAVSGELDPRLGGPSRNLADGDHRRRTLYGAVSRHNLDGLLRLFDFPDPNLTCDRRVVTSVPLQQLFVLNSEFMIRRAEALARRISAPPQSSNAERVTAAFQLLFGRDPKPEERAWSIAFLEDAPSNEPGRPENRGGWRERRSGAPALDPNLVQFAQALLGSNEFMFVD